MPHQDQYAAKRSVSGSSGTLHSGNRRVQGDQNQQVRFNSEGDGELGAKQLVRSAGHTVLFQNSPFLIFFVISLIHSRWLSVKFHLTVYICGRRMPLVPFSALYHRPSYQPWSLPSDQLTISHRLRLNTLNQFYQLVLWSCPRLTIRTNSAERLR